MTTSRRKPPKPWLRYGLLGMIVLAPLVPSPAREVLVELLRALSSGG